MSTKKRRTSKVKDTATHLIATIISRVFDPPVILPLLTMFAVLRSDISHYGLIGLIILLPLFIGIPMASFLWLLKTHKVHNWDVTNRKERIVPLLLFLGYLSADIFVLALFDNPFLLNIFILYFLWTAGFLLITLFWKISGHSGITTLAAALVMVWFGIHVWPVFFIIVLVSWARVVRGDHTLLQVIAGIIYSLLMVEIWKNILPI